MRLDTFYPYGSFTGSLTAEQVSVMPPGVFKAPLWFVKGIYPDLVPIIEAGPIEDFKDGGSFDIRVHMLLQNQYPCIPGWHCDFVPRKNGALDYSKASPNSPPMYAWISGSPCTQYTRETGRKIEPKNHGHLKQLIEDLLVSELSPNLWYRFTNASPHAGSVAKEFGWRVFMRWTPADPGPEGQWVRRHVPVYLDAQEYHW